MPHFNNRQENWAESHQGNRTVEQHYKPTKLKSTEHSTQEYQETNSSQTHMKHSQIKTRSLNTQWS